MAEGPCVSLIASRLCLAPALVIWMVKKRLVIRALERPAECREEGGGGREDGSWMVDSDCCFDFVLFFPHLRTEGAY
jgi:hypothetical protein